ncbi:MAG: hypothetical protein JNG89_21360 [Planctomycetaceae bacterium]|nr:hypothetical protein [Planctomycetaceae bacterium]
MQDQPVISEAAEPTRKRRLASLRTATPDWLFSAVLHVLLLAFLFSSKAGPGGGGPGGQGRGSGDDGFGNDPGRWIEAQLVDGATGSAPVRAAPSVANDPPKLAPVEQIPELAAVPEPTSEERASTGIVQTSLTHSSMEPSSFPADSNGNSGDVTQAGGGGAGEIGGVGQGAGDGSPGEGGDGQGGTSLFGIWDAGERFVYVIDRSSSMMHYDKLIAARRELESSLKRLDESAEFQILFYNQEVRPLPIHGARGLVRANRINKNLAGRQIRLVVAEGGTGHRPALEAALRLRPTVVYFLTDAEDPGLLPEELAAVARSLQGKTRIHCIQFGDLPGIAPTEGNWLSQLAAATGGQYLHFRTTALQAADGNAELRR